MQAQGISPHDFGFGLQKDAVALAAESVRRRGWGLSNDEVWQWLSGLAEGEVTHGRGEFDNRSIVREFARYLVALNASDDYADNRRADRLSNDVARTARREITDLGGRS